MMLIKIVAPSLLFLVAAGSLAGCQHPLEVDRAFYRCESPADCGGGYTCGEHPDHGKVCLPQGQAPGEADSGQDDIHTPPPDDALFVELSEEVGELARVQVYLIDNPDAAFSCANAMAERARSWSSKEADVGEGGSMPQIYFEQPEGEAAILATGFSADGVRTAVGCVEGLSAPVEEPVGVALRRQLPAFAPQYDAEFMWKVSNVYGNYFGDYVRGLARLPMEPETALLGCDGAESSYCDGFEQDLGLIQIALMARGAQMAGDETADARLWALVSDPTRRDKLRVAFSNREAAPEFGVDGELLWELTTGMLSEAISMSARVSLKRNAIDGWNEGVPYSNSFRATFTIDGAGLALCEEFGSVLSDCARHLAGSLNDSDGDLSSIEINQGEVLGSTFIPDVPDGTKLSSINLQQYYTVLFRDLLYPAVVEDPEFDPNAGFENFLFEGRWDCEAVAAVAGDADYEYVRSLCNEITAPSTFQRMLRDRTHDDKFHLEFHADETCELGEPVYAESDWWTTSGMAPMPTFTTFGVSQECSFDVPLIYEAQGSSLGSTTIVFSGQAESSGQ